MSRKLPIDSFLCQLLVPRGIELPFVPTHGGVVRLEFSSVPCLPVCACVPMLLLVTNLIRERGTNQDFERREELMLRRR